MSTDKNLWMGDMQPWMDEAFVIKAFNYYEFYPKGVKLIHDKITKEQKNFCFINFETIEEANKCLLSLNGKNIPNTTINFKLNWANYYSTFNKSVYVGNLSPDVDDLSLYKLFKDRYPSVLHASVITDKGTSKGFGFILIKGEEDYERCLKEMNGITFHGNVIKVNEQKKKEDKSKNNGNNINSNFNENDREYNYDNIIFNSNQKNFGENSNFNINYLGPNRNQNFNDINNNNSLFNYCNINDTNNLFKKNINIESKIYNNRNSLNINYNTGQNNNNINNYINQYQQNNSRNNNQKIINNIININNINKIQNINYINDINKIYHTKQIFSNNNNQININNINNINNDNYKIDIFKSLPNNNKNIFELNNRQNIFNNNNQSQINEMNRTNKFQVKKDINISNINNNININIKNNDINKKTKLDTMDKINLILKASKKGKKAKYKLEILDNYDDENLRKKINRKLDMIYNYYMDKYPFELNRFICK